ncbi:tRNase Z TRZ3, mitochondrial-like isoform X2 [Magnolia sinica]|uniref:tRNase Z TRZ3, mitochondrial-like isoform X2 n=1 Tax=Magnolia sinica TaxID=86752 RepID=UPI002659CCCC|nr:tRNase Z TRZ3, mitochondrial-like isoform X2 [Magnolia sinica]
MPQLSTVRLFFSSNSTSSLSLPFKLSFPSSYIPCKPYTSKKTLIFPLFSASSKRERKPFHQRRSSSNLRDTKNRERMAEMDEKDTAGFNKRRVEGREKGAPKNLQLKTRKLNPVNTICYVQGLQRFCTEHKIKLSKIDHMFLTRVCSETAGGLPGLLLTLAGMGDEGMSVNVWGPSDLKYLVDAMRSFIPTAAMVHTRSFGPGSNAAGSAFSKSDLGKFTDPIVLIDDEVVKISAILLRPSCSEVIQKEDVNVSNSSAVALEENMDCFSKPLVPCTLSSTRRAGPMLKPGDISVVYACELPEIKGKFDPAKAAALGLKPGPKYRELQLGNSVMSDRQNIMVNPSDVLGPSSPGPIVLLVDCPTSSHLQGLLSIQSLNDYYADNVDKPQDSMKSVNCVIHLGPASVTMTADYQKWMKRFGGAQHIMAGHEIKNMEVPILKSSARIASRLNYLCPQFFPAPGFWSLGYTDTIDPNTITSSEDSSPTLGQSLSAENLLKFHLRPYAQLGLDRSGIPSLQSPTEIVNELLLEIPEIEDASKHVSQFWHGSENVKQTVPPTHDHLIMIEEPWMHVDTCISDKGSATQATNASQEEISHLNGSTTSNVKNGSDIPSCLENISREDMEIVLLGTGSSQPSKYRNVSSIYVNLFSKGSLLLDCGEGTLAQLKRRLGVKGADDAVKVLRCIWISHIHADHHAGLARILSLRRELLRGIQHEPLLVIGPRPLKRFLDAYSRLEDLDMQFLDCRHTIEASWDVLASSLESGSNDSSSSICVGNINTSDGRKVMPQNIETTLFAKGSKMQSFWKKPGNPVDLDADFPTLKKLHEVLHEAGLEALISVPVVHCPQAFGAVLKAAERINGVGKAIPGWKLVYSGDTRPCQALIDASYRATVLIHEATFEDGMVEEAVAKNHSTTKEAVEVGASAGAYRIILTHFSQRYPKIPVFDEAHMNKTCIAFDMMSINIADLPVLPKVLPYLKLLFRNEMITDESDDILLPVEQAD